MMYSCPPTKCFMQQNRPPAAGVTAHKVGKKTEMKRSQRVCVFEVRQAAIVSALPLELVWCL